MSTPFPPGTKLEGLDLYAPRHTRTQSTRENQASDPQAPLAPEYHQPPAQNYQQASTADSEPNSTAETPIDSAIKTAIDPDCSLRRLLRATEPSLPLAANLRPAGRDVANCARSQSKLTRLDLRFTETALPWSPSLDPDIVPAPPKDLRRPIAAPMLASLAVVCAAIAAYCLTIAPGFKPDGRSAKHTVDRVSVVTPSIIEAAGAQRPLLRLAFESQKASANEPLSLGVSIDSTAGNETLKLAGLTLGTRLSAGAAISETSWQLSSRDLDGTYVQAPKDFVGTMNIGIELLSPNKRLIESRTMRLEWIAKPSPQQPDNRSGIRVGGAAAVQSINPEGAKLMDRGQNLLKSGDVSSARLLFRRLADAGIADAALALATTYDPRYIAKHNLIGIAADETMARDWYDRASELGSTEARGILAQPTAR
jgi:hypothetical protein